MANKAAPLTTITKLPQTVWVKKARAAMQSSPAYTVAQQIEKDEDGEPVYGKEDEEALEACAAGEPGEYHLLEEKDGQTIVVTRCQIRDSKDREMTPGQSVARMMHLQFEHAERSIVLKNTDVQELKKEIKEYRDEIKNGTLERDKLKDEVRELKTKLELAEGDNGIGEWASIAEKAINLFQKKGNNEELFLKFQLILREFNEEEQRVLVRAWDLIQQVEIVPESKAKELAS